MSEFVQQLDFEPYRRLVLFPIAFMKLFAFFQFFPIPGMGSGFRGNIYLIGAGLSIMATMLASKEFLEHTATWEASDVLYYSFLSYLYGLILCAPFVVCVRAVIVVADIFESFVNTLSAPARSELLQDEVTSFGHIVGMFLILEFIDEPYFNAITTLIFWHDVEIIMLFYDWNAEHFQAAFQKIDISVIYTVFVKLLPLFGVVTVLELLGILVARFMPSFNMFIFLFPIKYMVGLYLLVEITRLVVVEVINWVRHYAAFADV